MLFSSGLHAHSLCFIPLLFYPCSTCIAAVMHIIALASCILLKHNCLLLAFFFLFSILFHYISPFFFILLLNCTLLTLACVKNITFSLSYALNFVNVTATILDADQSCFFSAKHIPGQTDISSCSASYSNIFSNFAMDKRERVSTYQSKFMGDHSIRRQPGTKAQGWEHLVAEIQADHASQLDITAQLRFEQTSLSIQLQNTRTITKKEKKKFY